MEDPTGKPKKKSFSAPSKIKDGTKLESNKEKEPNSAPLVEKKIKSKNVKAKSDADEEKSVKAQKYSVTDVTAQHKTEQNNSKSKKDSKKEKKGTPTAPPKSLSDAHYEALFKAVLEKATADNYENDEDSETQTKDMKPVSDNGAENEGNTSKETSKDSGENNGGNASKENDDDDLESLASDDVDTWTDSPLKNEIQDNRNHHPSLKPKSVLQKKAERSGVLKPKQLVFPETKNTEGQKEKKEGQVKDKGIKSQDTLPLKKKDKQNTMMKLSPCKRKEEGCNKTEDPNNMVKQKKGKERKNILKPDVTAVKSKTEVHDDHEEETGTWIQCSIKECNKWRYVAGIEDPILVPALWECKMNPDKNHNACNLPEVDYDESEHICTKFTIGSLVWAKMAGYPWWPGMIEEDPDYDTYFELLTEKSMVPFQYHVTFFDDHVTRAWIRTNFIAPYIKGHEPVNKPPKMSKGRNLYKKEIQQATTNADKAMALGLQKRISMFGFSQRYKRKSKGRMKEINSSKINPKSGKKLSKGKKTQKEFVESEETQVMSDNNTNYSSDFNDLSDTMEDTEYKPIKTKSRGRKDTPACEDVQSLEVKTPKSDVSSDEDEDEAALSQEKSGGSTSLETKLDPDVFTMEVDSAPLPHHENDTSERKHSKSGDNISDQNVDENNQENENNDIIPDNICCKESDSKETDCMQNENFVSSNNKSKFNFESRAKAHLDKKVNQEKSKLTLKSKTPDEEQKQKLETLKMKDSQNEINVSEGNNAGSTEGCRDRKEIDKTNDAHLKSFTNCSGDTNDNEKKNKKNRKKQKAKENKDSTDVNEDCSEELKRDEKKDEDKNHKEAKKINRNAHINVEKGGTNHCDMTDSKTSLTSEAVTSRSAAENKKGGAFKNKSKKAKRTISEGDSDKENIEPPGNVTSKKGKYNKEVLKRTASSNIRIATVHGENNDANKHDIKKLKTSTSSDDESKIATKKPKMKEEKSRQKNHNRVKGNEKMKSFSAPVKMCKTSDREVPQLSSSCGSEDKDKACTYKKSEEGPRNTDQHIVPDMSQEKDTDTLLDVDIDIEQPSVNEIKKNIKQIDKSGAAETSKNMDDINNGDSEEEELDLDIDVENVGPHLPKKFLYDSSDESDDDEMKSHPNNDRMVIDKVKDDLQIFGRFAGRCTEHGSDSDPMELIED